MKIETFKDGLLVESNEIEDFNFPPNFYNFNTEMLFSPSYIKITTFATNQDAKSTLQLLSVRLELKGEVLPQDLTIFKIIWDAVIDSIPEGILIPEDKEEFNSKAENNHIPFRFGDDFKLLINLAI